MSLLMSLLMCTSRGTAPHANLKVHVEFSKRVTFAEYGLFCRIWSLLQGSFAKETYNFKEPTNRSHPIYSFDEGSFVEILGSFADIQGDTHVQFRICPTHMHQNSKWYMCDKIRNGTRVSGKFEIVHVCRPEYPQKSPISPQKSPHWMNIWGGYD